MNFGETSGESSSSGRENGAALLDTDRPHKKARFPWQIKGKHHLKPQAEQQIESPAAAPEGLDPTILSPEPVISREKVVPCKPLDNSCAGLGNEIKSNSRPASKLVWNGSGRSALTNSDPSSPLPLETVISLAESMILRSEMGCKISHIEVNDLLENHNIPVPGFGPPSPATQRKRAARNARRLRREEESCISRWQAAQTVKGCFDNTINRVLESWMSAPAPAEERFLALDFARIMNDLPQNDDIIENEGILMAINAHGLQNVPTIGGIPAIAPTEQLAITYSRNYPINDDSDSSICSEDLARVAAIGSCSPWPDDEQQTSQDQESGTVATPPWRQVHESRDTNQPDSYQYYENNQNGEDYNEYEFMNAAVIQAIKSKGLMAAGTDFG